MVNACRRQQPHLGAVVRAGNRAALCRLAYQVRLAQALVRLAHCQDIATVARVVGYDSASAFTAMFRQSLGKTPRDYFN